MTTIISGNSPSSFGDDISAANLPTQGSIVGYQQGAWTPTLTVGTASFISPTWARIGNQVTVNCSLGTFTDTTSNSPVQIEGMPYQVTGRSVGSAMVNKGVTALGVQVDHVYIEGTRLAFINSGANDTDSWQNLKHNNFGTNNCDIWFTIAYLTDDTTWTPQNGATAS